MAVAAFKAYLNAAKKTHRWPALGPGEAFSLAMSVGNAEGAHGVLTEGNLREKALGLNEGGVAFELDQTTGRPRPNAKGAFTAILRLPLQTVSAHGAIAHSPSKH